MNATVKRDRLRLAAGAVVAALVIGGLVSSCKREGPVAAKSPAAAATTSPDVLLITIDTLRADAVGFAGNRRVQTPTLDRLAGQGLVFTNAHAHNVVTLASHTNILTGLYPYQHGVRDNTGFRLAADVPTLATALHEKGYATGAFVGAFPLDSRFGLNRGFDVYDDRYRKEGTGLDFDISERSASEVIAAAQKWYAASSGKPRLPVGPSLPTATRRIVLRLRSPNSTGTTPTSERSPGSTRRFSRCSRPSSRPLRRRRPW